MKARLDQRQFIALILTLLALAALPRILAIPNIPTTWDEVDFTCALNEYDISTHSPHFPGYPAYVTASRLFAVALPARYALALPGILSNLCLGLAIALFLYHRHSHQSALTALLILSLSPLAIAESARPMADSLAMSVAGLAWISLCQKNKAWLITGAVLLGLLPAIKADHGLLWSLLFLAPKHSRVLVGKIILLTFISWNALFFSIVSPHSWLHEGHFFILGHFQDWGGSIHSTPNSIPQRILTLINTIGLSGLGLPTILQAPILIWCLYAYWTWKPNPLKKQLTRSLLLLLPMLLWTLFAQNLSHPRHILIFLPFLIVTLASLCQSTHGQYYQCILLACLIGQPQKTPGQATNTGIQELHDFLSSNDFQNNIHPETRFYVGESARLLRLKNPHWDIRRARTTEQIQNDLEADPCPPRIIVLSSEVNNYQHTRGRTLFKGPHTKSYQLIKWNEPIPNSELIFSGNE